MYRCVICPGDVLSLQHTESAYARGNPYIALTSFLHTFCAKEYKETFVRYDTCWKSVGWMAKAKGSVRGYFANETRFCLVYMFYCHLRIYFTIEQ